MATRPEDLFGHVQLGHDILLTKTANGGVAAFCNERDCRWTFGKMVKIPTAPADIKHN